MRVVRLAPNMDSKIMADPQERHQRGSTMCMDMARFSNSPRRDQLHRQRKASWTKRKGDINRLTTFPWKLLSLNNGHVTLPPNTRLPLWRLREAAACLHSRGTRHLRNCLLFPQLASPLH